MITLKEYFSKDFSVDTFDFSLVPNNNPSKKVLVKVGMETYSDAKFLIFYIPDYEHPLQICLELLNKIDEYLNKSNSLNIMNGFMNDIHLGNTGSNFAGFSKKIYFYMENSLSQAELDHLDREAKLTELSVTIRNKNYLSKKIEIEKPLAFISHDSRDKTEVALPIATGLQRLMCPVWYDEFSLKVGDNLRESIEKGIKETKKCILIVSKNFISNNGWTKTEFDSIFIKEIVEKSNAILQVWVDVTQEEVYNYSPFLAGKMAIKWDEGKEKVINDLFRVITL